MRRAELYLPMTGEKRLAKGANMSGLVTRMNRRDARSHDGGTPVQCKRRVQIADT